MIDPGLREGSIEHLPMPIGGLTIKTIVAPNHKRSRMTERLLPNYSGLVYHSGLLSAVADLFLILILIFFIY